MIQAQTTRRSLARRLAPVAAITLILFHESISRTVLGWFTFEESHGLLIFAISLYMIWAKRETLRGLPTKPSLLMGSVILALGCLAYLSARWSSTLLLEQISLILVLLGITTLILGTAWLKILSLPISYLLFMFTAFQELLFPVSAYMQHITSWIASGLLRLTGMPVLLSANYITLPHITLVVARECNGSHHIIALLALAVPLAYFTQETWLRRSSVILAAFLVGMFANGVRVMLIGHWSVSHKTDQLHGPFNVFYASFIFFFGMLLLVGGTLLTARRARRRDSKHPARPAGPSCPAPVKAAPQGSLLSASSSVLALILLAATLALAVFREPSPVPLESSLAAVPLVIDGWRGQDEKPFPGSPFEKMNADEEIRRSYQDNSGRNVLVYIGYFPVQRQDREIINDRFHWQIENGFNVSVPLVAGGTAVRKVRFAWNAGSGDLYYFYLVNGRILTSRYDVKVATMLDAFTRRRTNGAIVAVLAETVPGSQTLSQEDIVQFLSRVIPFVREFIPS